MGLKTNEYKDISKHLDEIDEEEMFVNKLPMIMTQSNLLYIIGNTLIVYLSFGMELSLYRSFKIAGGLEMNKEGDNTFYLKLKQNMLRFAQKLDILDNVFLKRFSQYLKEIYKDDKLKEISGCDLSMEKLKLFISHFDYVIAHNKVPPYKGWALLGKTAFDKLDFTIALLENYGGLEYSNDGITHKRYAVVDCKGKAIKAETIEQYAGQYYDVPFVIFNNCENILKQEDNLKRFKYLSESSLKLKSHDTATDKFKYVETKSLYILLGNENKIHEILEKTSPDSRDIVSDRINTFACIIRIFDFDDNEDLNEILHEIGIKVDENGKNINKSNEDDEPQDKQTKMREWSDTLIKYTEDALSNLEFGCTPDGKVKMKKNDSSFGYILLEDALKHKYIIHVYEENLSDEKELTEDYENVSDMIEDGWVLD